MTGLKNPAILVGALLCLLCQVASKETFFINDWRESFEFECPIGEHIYYLMSQHSNSKEDRRWGFDCRKGSVSDDCAWTAWMNDPNAQNHQDNNMERKCSGGGVVAGIRGAHVSGKEDRRWKIKCCKSNTKRLKSCSWTAYLNEFDGLMDWDVNPDRIINGIRGEFKKQKG